jgi:hypothetical protein
MFENTKGMTSTGKRGLFLGLVKRVLRMVWTVMVSLVGLDFLVTGYAQRYGYVAPPFAVRVAGGIFLFFGAREFWASLGLSSDKERP